MNKMIPRNILKSLTLLTIVTALASCTDNFLSETPSYGGENDGRIHFSVLPPASSEVEMMSRATIPATDPEKAIYTLRIMIFDGDGNIIPDDVFKLFDNSFTTTVFGTENLDADGNMIENPEPFDDNEGFTIPVFDRHVYYSVTTTTTTADDGKVSTSQTVGYLGDTEPNDYNTPPEGTRYYHLDPSADGNLKNCQIWALANMGRWENSLVRHTDYSENALDEIRNIDDLRRLYGKRLGENFAANRPFLPMVGTISADNEIPVLDNADNTEIIKTSSGTTTFSDIFGNSVDAPIPTGYSYAAPGTLDLTTPTTIGNPKKILMDQIVAKVRFNITMPAATDTEQWEFYFDNWTVENVPRYTYIIPHRKDIADYVSNATYSQAAFGKAPADNAFLQAGLYMPDKISLDDLTNFEHNGFGDGESTGDWIGPGKSSPNAAAAADENESSYIYQPTGGQYYYHFYTYGNRRGGRGQANVNNLSGTSYDEYSREDNSGQNELYKTLYAPDNATFLILRGIVRRTYTDAGVEHKESRSVCYKIALGGNRYDDYNVCRNTCYTLHIQINGFGQNDLQVSTDYNSSVHQYNQMSVRAPLLRMFDCHYDMRYVQFTGISDNQQDVLLRIYATEEEAKHATYAADGTTVSAYGTDKHGISAVTWLKIGKYDRKSGHDFYSLENQEGIVQTNIFADNNESTFCIHSDEYVVDSNGNTPTDNRKAWLQICQTYHGLVGAVEALKDFSSDASGHFGTVTREIDNGGSKETVYDVYFIYPIEQYPPIKKTITYQSDPDANGNTSTVTETLLVERFEEYTLPLDPSVNASSAGLRWGWSRYLANDNYNFYKFTQKTNPNSEIPYKNTAAKGDFNTPIIATEVKKVDGDNENVKDADISGAYSTRYSLHDDFAARYCYDKGAGKDEYGNDHHVWYLPSINELNALTGAEEFAGDMNSWENVGNNQTGTEDGPIYWSSTTYTDPNNYPKELLEYWYDYGRDKKTYIYLSGWNAAWLNAWNDKQIYLTRLGRAIGRDYSVNYLREVWDYMELTQKEENLSKEYYPYNCAVASCNGMHYLDGYSRKWNADNSKKTDTKFLPRSREYRVRAVRKAPQ